MTIIFISSLLFILIREYFFIAERKEWKEERQLLLDRIQARDFTEYKVMNRPIEEKEKEKKEKIEFL